MSRRFLISRRMTILCVLTMVAFKFWLIHSEEISGSATRYDALWFVNSAKHWYWGARYDWIAFVRPPAYPLWIATVHFLGARQRIAIELLQIGGFLLLIFAFRRAGLPRWLCLLAFSAACFHPGGFQLNNYTLADPFYAAVLSFLLGGMILTMLEGKVACAVGTGVALAVLWNTREESVLITFLLVAFLAIWFLRERARCLRPALVMIGTFVLLVLLVYTANYRTYRAFAKSDMTAPNFEAAFNALNRIDAKTAQRYIPIPTESLREAYRVSPTFALLRPELDGPAGNDWRAETLKRLGIPNEIGVNWLLWALRDSASRTGMHADPKRADQFYKKVAREINQACRQGKVESRFVWASFIGPVFFQNAHFLPSAFGRVMKVFIAPYEMTRDRNDFILLPEERALYDEMTLRRTALVYDANEKSTRVENWIGAYYRFFLVSLGIMGVAAGLILLLHWRRLRFVGPLEAVLALVLVAVVARILLFTVLTAMSWPCDYDRFLFPVMPLSSIFLIALMYHAVVVLRRSQDI